MPTVAGAMNAIQFHDDGSMTGADGPHTFRSYESAHAKSTTIKLEIPPEHATLVRSSDVGVA
jgi:hypothetical protein